MPISMKSGFAFQPRQAAITTPQVVQSKTTQNGSASTTTMNLVLTSPVSSGNTLVISVGCAGALAGDTATFTDDKGNTYTTGLAFVFESVSHYGVAIAYLNNVLNGPQTITVTLNNTRTFLTMIADEWTHLGPLDVAGAGQGQSNPTLGANVVTSTAITTVTNGDLIYGVGVSSASLGFTNGTGFTPIQSVASTFYTEYLIQSIAGSIAATFTANQAGDSTVACVLPFKVM